MSSDDPVKPAPVPIVQTVEPDAEVERELLERAIGGWRGLIDSGVPTLVFVIAYVVTSQQMRPSLIAALVSGGIILVWRLLRRESLQQVISGFAGVAVSAFVASRTGRAQDYFLIGMLTNLAYGSAMLISLLVKWPLIGVLIGALQGDPSGWRAQPELRAAYRLSTWIWVALFFGRLAIEVPLYLTGAVGALGVAKVLLGWPPFLLAAYLTYRIVHPVLAETRQAAAESADAEDVPDAPELSTGAVARIVEPPPAESPA